MSYRKLLPLISLALVACSNAPTSSVVDNLAAQQVKQITPYLPMKTQGYNLIMAERQASVIHLVFIPDNSSRTQQTPQDFLHAYQQKMCVAPTVRRLLDGGVSYLAQVNNNQHQSIATVTISTVACQL